MSFWKRIGRTREPPDTQPVWVPFDGTPDPILQKRFRAVLALVDDWAFGQGELGTGPQMAEMMGAFRVQFALTEALTAFRLFCAGDQDPRRLHAAITWLALALIWGPYSSAPDPVQSGGAEGGEGER